MPQHASPSAFLPLPERTDYDRIEEAATAPAPRAYRVAQQDPSRELLQRPGLTSPTSKLAETERSPRWSCGIWHSGAVSPSAITHERHTLSSGSGEGWNALQHLKT